MKNKILISTIAVLVACPAFADIDLNNNNPTCDSTTIGATSGDTALDAVWNIVNQTCSAGQYFNMTTATCVTCTANSYCPGGTYNVESQTNGLNSCPNGYGLSAQGAGAQTDCYRTCTTSDVAHSTAVSGEYYYGDNNQCEPTSCETGYTARASLNLYTYSDTVPTSNRYKSNSGNGQNSDDTTGLENGEWEITSDYGTVYGAALCSSTDEEWATIGTPSNTEGRYCWCKVTAFKAFGVETTQNLLSSWVFRYRQATPSSCADYCAQGCASNVQNLADFRSALYATVEPFGPVVCSPNTINIKWYNEGSVHDENTCTYAESVTLPETNPQRTGYNFTGWTVRPATTPAQVE